MEADRRASFPSPFPATYIGYSDARWSLCSSAWLIPNLEMEMLRVLDVDVPGPPSSLLTDNITVIVYACATVKKKKTNLRTKN